MELLLVWKLLFIAVSEISKDCEMDVDGCIF